MVNITLAFDGGEGIQLLGFFWGAKSCQGEHLGLTAGKQARAMRPRADAYFTPDRAEVLRLAAVRAFAIEQDTLAYDLAVDFLEGSFSRDEFFLIFTSYLSGYLFLKRIQAVDHFVLI